MEEDILGGMGTAKSIGWNRKSARASSSFIDCLGADGGRLSGGRGGRRDWRSETDIRG